MLFITEQRQPPREGVVTSLTKLSLWGAVGLPLHYLPGNLGKEINPHSKSISKHIYFTFLPVLETDQLLNKIQSGRISLSPFIFTMM